MLSRGWRITESMWCQSKLQKERGVETGLLCDVCCQHWPPGVNSLLCIYTRSYPPMCDCAFIRTYPHNHIQPDRAWICLSQGDCGKKDGSYKHMAKRKPEERNLRSNWSVLQTWWTPAQNSSRLALWDNQESRVRTRSWQALNVRLWEWTVSYS